jgi:hypothetical protein
MKAHLFIAFGLLAAASCGPRSGAKPDAGATGAAGQPVDEIGLGFADTSASVLTRGKHATRDAFYIQPTLSKEVVTRFNADADFTAAFDGGLYGSPLYLEDGPGGKGAFFVGTTTNAVYALDEATGATLWMHSIGAPPAQTGVGCGNVFPVGIIGTPVIDAASRTIYVAGAVGDAAAIMRHEIHALDVDTGQERTGWPVNVSAMTTPAGLAFNSPAQNQRSALALVGGILYVAYGGHAGDCGRYHGWVVAVDTAHPTRTGAWATGGERGEGIWAAGGLASAGDGVFAVTGNSLSNAAVHEDSEEVVHVTGLASVDRTRGIFFPGSWRSMDGGDADFGASNAVAFSLPDATPSVVIAAFSKSGLFFLLDPNDLGGLDGHLHTLDLTPPGGTAAILTASAAYDTPRGVHVVIPGGRGFGGCPAGSRSISLLVKPGAPPTAEVAFCSVVGGSASPIVTTTDGKSDAVIWFYDDGLFAVDGESGATLLRPDGIPPCAGLHFMQAPIAVKGRIIFGADGHLCSYSAR